jgi:hypothetical protein
MNVQSLNGLRDWPVKHINQGNEDFFEADKEHFGDVSKQVVRTREEKES